MAYQPKSYRKFLVGAVSTAVVASSFAGVAGAAANFTDVNSNYKEAVDFLVSKGINGISATEFGVQQNIKRVDAAVFVVKALGLDVNAAPASGFTDVPERAVKEVNALKAAGITSGKSATEFGAQDLITRGELAIWLTKAFDLQGAGDVSALTDATGIYTDAIKALVANNITKGTSATTFGTKDFAKRGDFAKFVYASANVDAELTVTGVSATNATTLTIAGTGLNQLKAEDITISGNNVTSVTPAADGKTATVKVGAAFVPDTEYKVTVKVNDESKDFTVKYKLDVTSVSVVENTYDDDTENQYVSFKVNGQVANVNDLLVNGYNVSFAATKKVAGVVTDATPELFGGNTTTGKLLTNLTAGTTYKVQVTVTKGSQVFVSEQAEIVIKNLQIAATSIESYELTNNTENVIQKSSTLVTGDNATITEMVVMQNGSKTTLNAAAVTGAVANNTLDIKSSNPAVISVNEAAATINANTPGTATITLTYGTVTKTINLTVAQEERKVTKVTPKSTSLTTILSPVSNNTLDYNIFDQYGDPVDATTLTVESTDTSVLSAVSVGASDTKGKATLTVTPAKVGNASVIFKNSDGKTVGSVSVKVTDNASVNKTALEIKEPTTADINAGQSEDATIDLEKENKVIFQLKQYTAENVELAPKNLNNYTAKFDKDIVKVNSDTDGSAAIGNVTELTIEPANTVKLGSTDIALYNENNVHVATVRVTVVDNSPKLSSVSLKSIPEVTFAGKKIDYKTVLDITEVNGDDIVNGVSLTKSASSVIRIDEVDGSLYLDNNGDANYTDEIDDTKLGTISLSAVSGSTGLGEFTSIITGGTTVAGDEGTLIITVKNNESTPKIVTSTSISVKVPQ